MFTLAIEQSSSPGSIAILEDHSVRASSEWTIARKERNRIFDAVKDICAKSDLELSEIDLFAVGTGPGNYSGLRIANAVVTSLALPAGRPVIGISSGEALARQYVSADRPTVTILGDARRDRVWLARFAWQHDQVVQIRDWGLVDFTDLPADCSADEQIVGPDWNSLAETLQEKYPADRLISEPCVPTAEHVAQIALEHFEAGEPFPGSEITYMHPAVFVAPKFPVE